MIKLNIVCNNLVTNKIIMLQYVTYVHAATFIWFVCHRISGDWIISSNNRFILKEELDQHNLMKYKTDMEPVCIHLLHMEFILLID